MEQKDIAAILLDRRNNLAPVVMAGEMRDKLGSDGYGEALRLGWIRPNMDTGELTITDQFQHLNAMRTVKEAAENPEPKISDEVTVAEEGKSFSATVKKVNTDGTLELSFGGDAPKVKKNYSKAEVRVTRPSEPTKTPEQQKQLDAAKPAVFGTSVSAANPGAYRQP